MTALFLVCVTTFAVCVAGAIIPLINTEIYLLSAVALSPPSYIPPLYVMSVACGTIGMSVATFFLIGTAGRLIHFTVVALLPQYAKGLLG